MKHMTENNPFSKAQHGFIKGKSCVTQLLEFSKDIAQAIDNGDDVDIIYLDFARPLTKSRINVCCRNYMAMEYVVKSTAIKNVFRKENNEL